MALKLSFEEFKDEYETMQDSYKVTNEDREKLQYIENETHLLSFIKMIVKTKLTDEKVMNYSLMFNTIDGIKFKFMGLDDKDKQEMTDNAYRKISKYVIELHRLKQKPIVKALECLLNDEMDRPSITKQVMAKRLDILFKTFATPMVLFNYLVGKFNNDEELPFWIKVSDEDDDIQVTFKNFWED